MLIQRHEWNENKSYKFLNQFIIKRDGNSDDGKERARERE